jgi:NAD-dependent dihydropyrimidine dehydrogenase PreA subunit
MYIEQGWGREISKLEALEYLHQNEEDGLIFRPGNTQKMDFVCSCCYCCCGTIANLKSLPNPANFTTSNYYALIDEDLCTGCGLCEDRCQMEAITFKNDIFSVDIERCIGCGNCIIICPSEAINLYRKKKQNIPPLTVEKLHQKLLDERKKLKNK